MTKHHGKRSDPVDIHVGGRIRQARLIAGISQTMLASALGLTFQQVQKYEKGTNRAGASRILRIAQRLNKPVQWFYEGAPGSAAFESAALVGGDPLQKLGETRDGVALARAFLAIPDGKFRAAIVALAEAAAATAAGDRALARKAA